MKYVYIGRFQPFHKGHKAVVDLTMKIMGPNDTFTIIIGSADQQETERNPLSVAQRKEMIAKELRGYSVTIEAINDSPYDYSLWIENLCFLLADRNPVNVKKFENICIVGMENVPDYVKRVNDYFYHDTGLRYKIFSEEDTKEDAHGQTIRKMAKSVAKDGSFKPAKNFYDDIKAFVSEGTIGYLKSVGFQDIILAAYDRGRKYAEATGCKYSSCFVTVDNIVYKSNDRKVLLIKRKDNGKLAIPGGFAEPYMDCKSNALRELFEETHLSEDDLKNERIDTDISGVIIDAPYRDPRSSDKCNFVSVVYVWKQDCLNSPNLLEKKAKAGDDAAEVVWLDEDTCESLPASAFHADHKKILCKLLGWNYFKA